MDRREDAVPLQDSAAMQVRRFTSFVVHFFKLFISNSISILVRPGGRFRLDYKFWLSSVW